MTRPTKSEYPQSLYFSRYIESVDNEDVIEALTYQLQEIIELFDGLSEKQALYRYADGKWSLKQLLGHLTDTERIFSYRALCIARGDQNALPGFDENEYMTAANFEDLSLADLIKQYQYGRLSTLAMIGSFTEIMLANIGNANSNNVSTRAMIWMIAGHEAHHLRIIRERYL